MRTAINEVEDILNVTYNLFRDITNLLEQIKMSYPGKMPVYYVPLEKCLKLLVELLRHAERMKENPTIQSLDSYLNNLNMFNRDFEIFKLIYNNPAQTEYQVKAFPGKYQSNADTMLKSLYALCNAFAEVLKKKAA